ncbi:hypothetical protein ACFQ3L_09560 [Lacticaseibacillus jixianensis]|uniref:Uncharacterized protein n=1 Tax=Lacticaseibacillus jixianensis TaxID=2486012 RepID=A0ABW4BBM8_9LACO|nr:hypothetical protein [Lacticaseibacillus jixianensis]
MKKRRFLPLGILTTVAGGLTLVSGAMALAVGVLTIKAAESGKH